MAQEIADSTLLDTWGSGGNIVEPDSAKIIEGWQLGEQPPHEYMNWLQNTFGSKLNHILKNGVASWNNETQYLAGSSVQHNGNVWLCKTTNTNSEPTDTNANWKRIITIESLTSLLAGYVALVGDQTIAGIKTFSSSPIVPTPTTGTQAANKDYVDSVSTLDINTLTNKTTPVDADELVIADSDTSFSLKKLSWANLKESLKNTFLTKPELVSITGTATFDGLTQKITMTNIGNITLAIGDVIEVSGTTSNNKLFTVESIVDNNNIVVNYEHRGTSTPTPDGRLINETATATITLYNRAKNAPTGQGQYWCSPASGRTSGLTYTNNTKRDIEVFVAANINNETQHIGNFSFLTNDGSGNSNMYLTVNSGATYSIKWSDLLLSYLERR